MPTSNVNPHRSRIPVSHQEPLASIQSSTSNFKDIDYLCTSKVNLNSISLNALIKNKISDINTTPRSEASDMNDLFKKN